MFSLYRSFMSYATEELAKLRTAYSSLTTLLASGRTPKNVTIGDQAIIYDEKVKDWLVEQLRYWEGVVNAEENKGKSGRLTVRPGRT